MVGEVRAHALNWDYQACEKAAKSIADVGSQASRGEFLKYRYLLMSKMIMESDSED